MWQSNPPYNIYDDADADADADADDGMWSDPQLKFGTLYIFWG
jgi:hypothetical protein